MAYNRSDAAAPQHVDNARAKTVAKTLRGEALLPAQTHVFPISSRDFTLLGLSDKHWRSHFLSDSKTVSALRGAWSTADPSDSTISPATALTSTGRQLRTGAASFGGRATLQTQQAVS